VGLRLKSLSPRSALCYYPSALICVNLRLINLSVLLPPQPLCHNNSVTTSWLQLSLKAAPAALDTIANFLIERGSPGVVLKENEVRAFFPSAGTGSMLKGDIRRFLRGINQIYPENTRPSLRWTVLKDKNWNDSWRRFFTPQKVAKGFLISPPWLSPRQPSRRKVIEIEPGMAFGTGTHATTRGCLEFLEEVVLTYPRIINALDVGTGSGILAIALAKMGVKEVLALDNDPIALKVARTNVRRNGVGKAVLLTNSGPERINRPFRLVVANLTADVIIGLATVLQKRVARGGYLIISGILGPQVKDVVSCFKKPIVLIRQKSSKGWVTLVFNKEA